MTRKTKAEDGREPNADGQNAEGALEVSADLSALEAELERIRGEADAAADRALRTLAEFDNYRKRSERERREAIDVGAAGVLRELLDVADNFDRALEHAGDDVPASFLDGMKLIARGLHDLLDRRGVKRIPAVGFPFDPNVHEAIAAEDAPNAEPGAVLREVQPGYMAGTRVLRPAKVVVVRSALEGR